MLDEYDLRFLQEAKQRIEVVYTYHYGCSKDKKIVNRLSTIIEKIEFLIDEKRREDND